VKLSSVVVVIAPATRFELFQSCASYIVVHQQIPKPYGDVTSSIERLSLVELNNGWSATYARSQLMSLVTWGILDQVGQLE